METNFNDEHKKLIRENHSNGAKSFKYATECLPFHALAMDNCFETFTQSFTEWNDGNESKEIQIELMLRNQLTLTLMAGVDLFVNGLPDELKKKFGEMMRGNETSLDDDDVPISESKLVNMPMERFIIDYYPELYTDGENVN